MQVKAPKVSVIINVYNGVDYIKPAVESILSQTFTDFELIIFDNASIDGTGNLLATFEDDRIKVCTNDVLIPLYQARNLAVEQTCGEFIAFCDADDLWLETKLEEQLKAFRETKDLLMCTNFIRLNERNSKDEYHWIYEKLPKKANYDLIINDPYIHMSSLMVNRKIFSHHNIYFNAALTILGDMDFFVRCLSVTGVSAIDNYLTVYRYHETNTGLVRYAELYDEGIDLLKIYERDYPISKSVLYKFRQRINYVWFRNRTEHGQVNMFDAFRQLALPSFVKLSIVYFFPKIWDRLSLIMENKGAGK